MHQAGAEPVRCKACDGITGKSCYCAAPDRAPSNPGGRKILMESGMIDVASERGQDADRAPSTEPIIARQVATWRKEVARLQDLIITAEGAPSTDADALNALLWLYYRLPHGYERQGHIERTIRAIAARIGVDVESDIASRMGSTDRAPSTDSAAGWISVEDRLPEHDTEVAVIGPAFGDWAKGPYVSCALFMHGTFYERDEGGEMYAPSHWMPLPPIAAMQPPQDKETMP
jgi:hypothetical protein